jgi:YHS domain-containing protein
MWRILVYIILLGLVFWAVKKVFSPGKRKAPDLARPGEVLVQDPVCKCYIPRSEARTVDFMGEKIFFCSDECRRKFLGGNTLPNP